MMLKNLLTILLFLFAVTIEANEHIKIGTLSFKSKETTKKEWMSTQNYLNNVIKGVDVEIVPMDYPQLNQAVATKAVDFVITNSGHYVYLESKNHISRIATMIKYKRNHWLDRFGGIIFTRADNEDINVLQDLKNKKIAAVDVESLGGYAAQMYTLQKEGLDKDDVSFLFTGMSHANAVEKVLSFEADAGFVRTEVLESMVQNGLLKYNQIKILNQQSIPDFPFLLSTDLYPEWPIARMPHTSYILANKVLVALLSLKVKNEEGALRWTAPLEYRNIHEMFSLLELPPYDIKDEFTLRDIYEKYKVFLIAFLILLILLLIGVIREIYLRRKLESILNELNLSNAELRYQSLKNEMLLRLAGDGVHILNSQGEVIQVSETFCKMLGYQHKEMLGMTVDNWDMIAEAQDVSEGINKLGDASEIIHTKHRRKDGTMYDAEVIVTKIKIFDEELIYCSARDITDELLSQAQTKLAAIVYENSSNAISILDKDTNIISVNPSFEKLTGYVSKEIIGKNVNIMKSGEQNDEFYKQMWDDVILTGKWQGTIIDRKKDNSLFMQWLEIVTIFDEENQPYRRIAIFSEKTDEKEAKEEIWYQSNFDTLTDLPNRNMFISRLQKRLELPSATGEKIALIYIDLDNFKEINDSMGHDKGDALLRESAQRIKKCIHKHAIISRLGGDEFALVLPRVVLLDDVKQSVKKILECLSQPFKIAEKDMYISASIGIAIAPDDADGADTLLKNAEQAMYAAKNDGKNRYKYFTATMHEQIVSRMNLIEEMRRAIIKDEFVLHYQPIVDLANGKIHKAEALIRWKKNDGTLVSPGEFIALAEETGLIVEIGAWVIKEAATQVKRWRNLYDADFQISINKSPVQFTNENSSVSYVSDILKKIGTSTDAVVIEITEGLLMAETPLVQDKLYTMQKQGIALSLDDFGTGYSSLSYLKKFDIDYLKIDQSFVKNLEEDQNDKVLCEAIVAMAHKLKILVIAEGVETERQYSYLKSIQCDYVQGYFISRPIPAVEFEEKFFKL